MSNTLSTAPGQGPGNGRSVAISRYITGALGASQSNVLRWMLSEALWRVAVGAALGLVGACVVVSLFASLVFGVQTTSPAV